MTSNKRLRIGVTMRGAQAQEYVEHRDALAHDWYSFLAVAIPEAQWLSVPNLGGESALSYFQTWELNALLLTGGEDLGSNPLRDVTELSLLAHALSRDFPVLGICRGAQLIWKHFGGRLTPTPYHRATRHTIQFRDCLRVVNSYHTQGLNPELRPHALEILATAEDGSIEALTIHGKSALGLMWHPEREAAPSKQDIALIRPLFFPAPL
jgi:putative glutamine amidotransferase